MVATSVPAQSLHSRILYRMTNNMPDASPASPPRARRIPHLLAALAVGAALGLAGLYGVAGLKRNALADAPCASALEVSKKIAPLAKGEVAALTMATKPRPMPDL